MPKQALPVDELKRKIATEPDLSVVMNFFYDNFGDSDQFLSSSVPVEPSPELQYGFGAVISKLRNGPWTATSWRIMSIPLIGLVHGMVYLDGDQKASVVWAPELSAGIVSIAGRGIQGVTIARIAVTKETSRPN